ncbi:MAG: hypothetical protein ACI8WB_004141 [Phenylobacterium sp.]|jgi:hypothetical protein
MKKMKVVVLAIGISISAGAVALPNWHVCQEWVEMCSLGLDSACYDWKKYCRSVKNPEG